MTTHTRYIIVKVSRGPRCGPGYSGPTCEAAGVSPGRVYDGIAEAQSDANKLTLFNPVGFLVVPYSDNKVQP